MDNIGKKEARDYVSMAGFFILGLVGLLSLLGATVSPSLAQMTGDLTLVASILLFIVSIFLAVLGNRGLTTIYFLAMAMITMIGYFISEFTPVFIAIYLILALLMLIGPDFKRFVYFLISLIYAVIMLLTYIDAPEMISMILGIIGLVLLFWCTIACGAERTGFPGRDMLTEDEDIDFKSAGSSLGYLMFAMVCGVWVAYYLLTENFVSLEAVQGFQLLAGLMLFIIGILLFAVAKMRFTPMLFILVGFIFYACTIVSGQAIIAFGVAMILLGIIAFARGQSRILAGLFLVLYGLTFFVSVLITGNFSFGILHVVLNLLPFLVSLYLAFAVFSQNRRLLI